MCRWRLKRLIKRQMQLQCQHIQNSLVSLNLLNFCLKSDLFYKNKRFSARVIYQVQSRVSVILFQVWISF